MSSRKASMSLLALLFGLLAPLAGCGPNSPGGKTSLGTEPGDPPIGTKTDAKSVLDLYPSLLAGNKYVYLSVDKNGEVAKSTRVEAEVLEATADKAKVRLTIAGANSSVIDIDRAKPPLLPPGGLIFEGREQISVPAGSFNALKYSYTQGTSSFNTWAQRDVGILQTVEQKGFAHVVTTTLQSYEK
ncbi:MAG: hypothetical protein ACAI44_23770 [Candidatus Sericytochromatia bacterium]